MLDHTYGTSWHVVVGEGFGFDISYEVNMGHRVREELSEEMFVNSWRCLQMKSGKKYEFIFKGGKSLYRALLHLLQTTWKEEVCPRSWSSSTLIQLDKGKSSSNELEMKRHIHMKQDIQKLFCLLSLLKIL